MLSQAVCHRALETRDPRFDGRLFVGVTTIGSTFGAFVPSVGDRGALTPRNIYGQPMDPKPTYFLDDLKTPLGKLVVLVDETDRLRAIGFTTDHDRMTGYVDAQRAHATLEKKRDPGGFTSALEHYFAGDLSVIGGLAVAFEGTPFQVKVWRALLEIPCGETRSYGDIARRIRNPNAVRAVGLANGQNPIAIVVPCHRVIGANGTLTGYGGGIERKRWLLAHERSEKQSAFSFAR
ncbi:hypothetical protein BH09MYX1_BH09MYX1_02630 [soil metagenome]